MIYDLFDSLKLKYWILYYRMIFIGIYDANIVFFFKLNFKINKNEYIFFQFKNTLYICLFKILNMIQRIQSVYFFLAVLVTALIFFFPLAEFYGSSNFLVYAYKIEFYDPDPTLILSPYFLMPLMSVLILIIMLTLTALFSFKNRKRQLALTKISMALTLIFLGGYFFGYITLLEESVGNPPQYDFASFLPALTFLFLILANNGVQKDEKLIKSMDRLR